VRVFKGDDPAANRDLLTVMGASISGPRSRPIVVSPLFGDLPGLKQPVRHGNAGRMPALTTRSGWGAEREERPVVYVTLRMVEDSVPFYTNFPFLPETAARWRKSTPGEAQAAPQRLKAQGGSKRHRKANKKSAARAAHGGCMRNDFRARRASLRSSLPESRADAERRNFRQSSQESAGKDMAGGLRPRRRRRRNVSADGDRRLGEKREAAFEPPQTRKNKLCLKHKPCPPPSPPPHPTPPPQKPNPPNQHTPPRSNWARRPPRTQAWLCHRYRAPVVRHRRGRSITDVIQFGVAD